MIKCFNYSIKYKIGLNWLKSGKFSISETTSLSGE
jgi:hypothetical protein